jgi:hypothetical protein
MHRYVIFLMSHVLSFAPLSAMVVGVIARIALYHPSAHLHIAGLAANDTIDILLLFLTVFLARFPFPFPSTFSLTLTFS